MSTSANKPLCQYLRRERENGVNHFALKLHPPRYPNDPEVWFYIHPATVSGETQDYSVSEDPSPALSSRSPTPSTSSLAVPAECSALRLFLLHTPFQCVPGTNFIASKDVDAILAEVAKHAPAPPPAVTQGDSEAGLCERLKKLASVVREAEWIDVIETARDAIAALERLSGTNDLLTRCWEEALPNIEKLKTSLRSSEAALALARQLASVLSADLQDAQERLNVEEADHFYEEEQLTAELTALRANAGEDSRLLDWLEVNKGRCGYSEQTYIGEGYFAHEYTQGDKYEAAPTLRQAIRAAMSATPPQAPLTSGGEK